MAETVRWKAGHRKGIPYGQTRASVNNKISIAVATPITVASLWTVFANVQQTFLQTPMQHRLQYMR